MKWNLKEKIIATVSYASLFDYPLTFEELSLWLITDVDQEISPETYRFLQTDGTYIGFSSSLMHQVKEREKRSGIAEDKWKIAKHIAAVLGHIPTIQLVGVSGGLAMNNTKKDDDIDFYIVVIPKTIWISRLLVLIVLQILGKRRKLFDKNTTDKICTNMFVDTAHLCLPTKEQDLYSAHEVLQMIPLVCKNHTYWSFLSHNAWVNNYLYNAWKIKIDQSNHYKKYPLNLWFITFYLLEFPAKYLQLWYMRKHRTTEVVSDTVLRFHPRDVRIFIRKNFLQILRKYKIPLDSSFLNSLQ